MIATPELYRLVYASKMHPSLQESDVQAILETAQKQNARNRVTGILLFRARHFLQLLEGERFDVAYTFKKIRDDPRHEKIEILVEQPTDHRMYENWAMHFRDIGEFKPSVARLVGDVMTSKKKLTRLEIIALLLQFNSAS